MKANNTIQETRANNIKVSGFSNGRQATIVVLPISVNKFQYGVQFWTPEQILKGEVINSDGSISTFVEIL